jgi:surface antigen
VLAVATVALSAGPVAALRRTVTAGDLGYPYPNAPDCNEQTGANCVGDKWGFVQGQCHSWVAYRLNELNAAELNGATFDDHYRQPAGQEWWNPVHWKTAAQAAGITVDDNPALGSVAWWSTNGGHVAYVEAVNADGSVKISEMNTDYHNGFDFATLVRGQRWPSGFIHIADRPSGASVPDAPTNVHAVAGLASATVTWSAPADNGSPITGYRVRTSTGDRSVLAAASATSVTIKRLQPATTYTFTVRAINAIGRSARSAPSNSVVPRG